MCCIDVAITATRDLARREAVLALREALARRVVRIALFVALFRAITARFVITMNARSIRLDRHTAATTQGRIRRIFTKLAIVTRLARFNDAVSARRDFLAGRLLATSQVPLVGGLRAKIALFRTSHFAVTANGRTNRRAHVEEAR